MNNKGFTLLEVLIATFILAVMSMMIWQIANNAMRGKNKASVYDSVYHNARVALKKFTDDVGSAFIISQNLQGKLSDGTNAIETSFVGGDEGDKDKLDFVAFSGRRLVKDEKSSDVEEVGYFISACEEEEEKKDCLMRRSSRSIDKDTKEGGTAQTVAVGVKSFELEYYDPEKQEWRSDWNSLDPGFLNKLPRAVKVVLTFPDPIKEDEELQFVSSVMLAMSAGAVDF